MNKEKYLKTMELLSGAYRDTRYIEEKTINAWYEFFKKYDNDVFYKAVVEWIENNPKSPSISELIGLCIPLQRKADREKKNNDGLEEYNPDDRDRANELVKAGYLVNDDGYWVKV